MYFLTAEFRISLSSFIKPMVYITSWDEFVERSVQLFRADPDSVFSSLSSFNTHTLYTDKCMRTAAICFFCDFKSYVTTFRISSTSSTISIHHSKYNWSFLQMKILVLTHFWGCWVSESYICAVISLKNEVFLVSRVHIWFADCIMIYCPSFLFPMFSVDTILHEVPSLRRQIGSQSYW